MVQKHLHLMLHNLQPAAGVFSISITMKKWQTFMGKALQSYRNSLNRWWVNWGESECCFECIQYAFKGKKVIVFDDILTKGFAYAIFANKIEKLGAEVLGGLFIGKTVYKTN